MAFENQDIADLQSNFRTEHLLSKAAPKFDGQGSPVTFDGHVQHGNRGTITIFTDFFGQFNNRAFATKKLVFSHYFLPINDLRETEPLADCEAGVGLGFAGSGLISDLLESTTALAEISALAATCALLLESLLSM